jgi:hypothetical protein
MKTIQDQINEQYAIIVASKDYLFNTDFYGHREYEGGAPMPEDVKTKRAQCRAKINTAQEVIKELERQKEHEDPEPPEPIGGEV